MTTEGGAEGVLSRAAAGATEDTAGTDGRRQARGGSQPGRRETSDARAAGAKRSHGRISRERRSTQVGRAVGGGKVKVGEGHARSSDNGRSP